MPHWVIIFYHTISFNNLIYNDVIFVFTRKVTRIKFRLFLIKDIWAPFALMICFQIINQPSTTLKLFCKYIRNLLITKLCEILAKFQTYDGMWWKIQNRSSKVQEPERKRKEERPAADFLCKFQRNQIYVFNTIVVSLGANFPWFLQSRQICENNCN